MNKMVTVENLNKSIAAIGNNIDTINGGLDVFYLLFAGALVFFMQAGFAMLCAGSIRAKNVKNIMCKNILDACGGAVGFWTIGYAFAYGGADSSKITFIGNVDFAVENIHDGATLIGWFFQFAFAATAATIVAGTVAERCKFEAYICYSCMLTGFVYPVVVHSIWSPSGFLSAFTDDENKFLGSGMIDFAGSGVVHMTGGITALFAAVILGPRIGRFYDADGNELSEPGSFPPHSVALQVLGTFILWVGWYGFNPGSTLGISASGYADISALCAVNTTLAAAAGSVSAMFTDMIMARRQTGEVMYDITMCMNGALSGLVGITAGCSVCEPWAALVIGIVAGWVYIYWSNLLVQLKIDDAVDAIPVHLGNGMWGCIATGLFASPELVDAAYGTPNYGWFYNWGSGSGSGKLFAVEVLGVFFIIGWVGLVMIPYFKLMSVLGIFRVDPVEEMVGLDICHHNGLAYNLDMPTVPSSDKGVIISDINYDGKVKRTESDEYVEITNESKSDIDISGYYVVDVNHPGTHKESEGATFKFPTPTVLKTGKSVRVYTNEIHEEYGGYSFGSGRAIWNNAKGKAVLKDSTGKVIPDSEFEYEFKSDKVGQDDDKDEDGGKGIMFKYDGGAFSAS